MSDNPTPTNVSLAASLMGRKGRGIKKTLSPEQREAKRERMRQINEAKRKERQ